MGNAEYMGIAWDPATSTTTTMNTFLFFSSLIAYVSAGTVAVAPVAGVVVGNAAPYLVRAPAHDSASIEHHRLGGNFAYSTAEAHAFAEVVPQISTLTHPIAETTHTHIPAAIATHQPSPIVRTTHVAQPIFKNIPTSFHAVEQVPVGVQQSVQHVGYAAHAVAPAYVAGYAGVPALAGLPAIHA